MVCGKVVGEMDHIKEVTRAGCDRVGDRVGDGIVWRDVV